MTTHELKSWPEQFEAISNETKRFELRFNDRGFEVGDILYLREWQPAENGLVARNDAGSYTGRELKCTVEYILDDRIAIGRPSYGLKAGWVAMSIRKWLS